MTKEDQEHAIILNCIDTLCVLCAAPREMVVNALTGKLWDEVEASMILNSTGVYDVVVECDKQCERVERKLDK